MDKPKQEICQIKIMFPVVSDEEAIEYKKKITAVLADISQARIDFSLSVIPSRADLNASGLV